MIKHSKIDDLEKNHKSEHEDYEYFKRDFLPRGLAKGCVVSIYEIPPKKSAYPYHYHHKNEEVFYVISGKGILRTPEGEREVVSGDLLFFPADASGAHKLTNSSDDEMLVYLDFDTAHDIDVTMYPDSDKIAVWGKGINKLFRTGNHVNYYDGE